MDPLTGDGRTTAASGGRWLPMLLCVALAALIAAPNFLAGLHPYDAGIAASAATFTLHGQLPYRDYWLLYGPLSGVLLAIPTALFGPSIELIRLVGLVILASQAATAYLIARSFAVTWAAIAIAVAAVAMWPVLLGIEPSSWSLAMALALGAIYLSVGTKRSGILVGIVTGFAFLARLDVGTYVLLSVLLVRERRATILGFGLVAVPFAVLALVTTDIGLLIEQLVWYPLVGPRQFRGLPGPGAIFDQATAAILSVPLVVVPRLAILLAAARLAAAKIKGPPLPGASALLGLTVFSLFCQLQTEGRADLEHYAQAATPAILLLAVWFRDRRPSLPRFGALVVVSLLCVGVALLGFRHVGANRLSSHDQAVVATSAWIRQATTNDEPIFVGLTSHRYTAKNPLLIYYLSGRRAGVHDALFNPGVTNTDWGQERMVSDLDRSGTKYLVLDRSWADLYEVSNDSRIAGSTLLDTYIAGNFHLICDLETLVIMTRNGKDLPPSPACPTLAP